MVKTMQAAVLPRPGAALEIREVPVPEPKAGELLIKLETCGVCHSDLHVRDGEFPPPAEALPLILGHEGVGRVVACGEATGKYGEGTRVGLPWLYDTCLDCRECETGWETFCSRQRARSFDFDGAFAEYALVKETFTTPVPDELDALETGPLMCAGLTAYGATRKADLAPEELCAIFGCGGLGLYGVQFAKLTGAKVVAVDLDDAKLAKAKAMGADYVVRADDNPGGKIKDLGGADACINYAPTVAVWDAMSKAINQRGVIVFVAIPPGEVPVSMSWVIDTGVSILGSSVGSRQELRDVLKLARDRNIRIDVEPVALTEANDALDRVAAGDVVGRLVIDMR